MASLRVKDQGKGPIIYGRWYDGTRRVERPIGRGWIVLKDDARAKPGGRTTGEWCDRRGTPQAGHLTVVKALQALASVEAAWREEQLAEQQAEEAAATGANLTMGVLAERYLEWGMTDDPHTERTGWKHSYTSTTRRYVGRIVRELGADRLVHEITLDDLRGLMAGLVPTRNGEPTGTKPSRKFLSNYALPLKGMFALALEKGWVPEDVSRGLPTYKPRRKRAADPVRREEYLTPEELEEAVRRLESAQDRAIIRMMAMTGLRPGEALALRWQDVDEAGSTVRVVLSRTLGVTGMPKSDTGRSVPLADEVARALEDVKSRGALVGSLDLVFIGKLAGHIDLHALRDRFYAAQDDAGIVPRRELRQLRNTFGTVMAAGGVSLRTIQEWMGHENITTTERYASHMPRARDAAIVSAAFAVETVALAA